MKVLHIINSLHTGGAEKLLVTTLPLLRRKGLDVDLLVLNGEETPFRKELQNGSDIEIGSLGRSIYNPFYIFRLIPYLKRYELIHVHLFPTMYFVALAKLLALSKTKIIFTEHSTSNRRLQHWIYRPMERMIYALYTAIVCISDSVKAMLHRELGLADDKCVVISNGIPLAQINQAPIYDRSQFGFQQQDKLICMVAAFRKEKDQDTAVRALQSLPAPYKLLFIGEGERLEIVKQLAMDLGLCERITFLGVRTDIYPLLKMCDIAVLSSHWEGFGLAAAEAMACGIPTIASRVHGLAQVVSGGGLLFEVGDEMDLVSKISSLENQDDYYAIQKRGLEKARQYDVEETADQLLSFYQTLDQKN